MAASTQPLRGKNKKSRRLISEINVTPMVDVMLVLLIIFMVTSPMLVAGIDVDLPQTDSSPISGDSNPLTISINKNSELFLLETKIDPSTLVDKLNEASKENKNIRIFVKGDKTVPYGHIVEVMARIHNAGFSKVALVSDIKYK